MTGSFDRIADRAAHASSRLAWVVERLCALLLIVLVLDVWLGVLVRYFIPMPITFTEEAARYLMIWMALLAVSCGIARREHIGVEILFDRLPAKVRRWLLLGLDLVAFAFFALLFVYGLDLVDRGTRSFTMIYGMTKSLPFASVPAAAALACVQLVLVAIRDQGRFDIESAAEIAP
jgi:TRAP-type C4-dicarboxylate transport system permease small subunit